MSIELKNPLSAYKSLGEVQNIKTLEIGLINKTFLVTTDKLKYIFQELSSIFNPEVNFDSDAVCKHLSKSSILSPQIYKNDEGDLFYKSHGKIYRALFYIEGESFNICTKEMASSAAFVIGQFHRALLDFEYSYRSQRKSAGDYDYHREYLVHALNKYPEHDFFKHAKELSKNLLDDMAAIRLNPTPVLRHIHGDPKISNIIFADDKALCLVDFDTLQRSSFSLELADAFRSWCNPFKEDDLNAHADLAVAEQALSGYAQAKCPFTLEEAENLAFHSEAISLCLSMRYLADTLCETYFNYDQKRFARRAEHNWLRAQAMYRLAQDFHQKRPTLLSMIKDFLL